jgi:glycosyltransferase involved in cell wall biosynthesis
MTRTVRILGTHGVPAAYGGFETAAQHVAMYLRDRGWNVVVYCQLDGDGDITSDRWNGIERVLVPEPREGWKGTSHFDLVSIRHATAHHREGDVWLTFGYNTGVLDVMPRLRGIPNVINMDGMEWTRRRWGSPNRPSSWATSVSPVSSVTCSSAITPSSPRICGVTSAHGVQTITYGAPEVISAPSRRSPTSLAPDAYGIVVCRPIPENSVLEIVTAWSARHRGMPLVVVGPYTDTDPYHLAVRSAASDEVRFPGAIFDADRLAALRLHAAVYVHGHTVGGTNPSLVEAMGAGNAVIAHDNRYNSWVAGPDNAYFRDADDLAVLLDELLPNAERLHRMGEASRTRYREEFTWEHIGAQYEHALLTALARHGHVSQRTEVLV